MEKSHSLKTKAKFGFVFRTLQPTCLLLLSAYSPAVMKKNAYDEREILGNYSVSLVDGRVHVRLNNGNGPIDLFSNVTYNDGEYHVISVIKQSRIVFLRINDELQMKKRFAKDGNVTMPENDGGLYIGGAPAHESFASLAPTFIGLQGAIKDIFFNDEIISYHSARNVTNVHLGRSGPAMGTQGINNILMKTEPISRSFKPHTEGCHRVSTCTRNSLL